MSLAKPADDNKHNAMPAPDFRPLSQADLDAWPRYEPDARTEGIVQDSCDTATQINVSMLMRDAFMAGRLSAQDEYEGSVTEAIHDAAKAYQAELQDSDRLSMFNPRDGADIKAAAHSLGTWLIHHSESFDYASAGLVDAESMALELLESRPSTYRDVSRWDELSKQPEWCGDGNGGYVYVRNDSTVQGNIRPSDSGLIGEWWDLTIQDTSNGDRSRSTHNTLERAKLVASTLFKDPEPIAKHRAPLPIVFGDTQYGFSCGGEIRPHSALPPILSSGEFITNTEHAKRNKDLLNSMTTSYVDPGKAYDPASVTIAEPVPVPDTGTVWAYQRQPLDDHCSAYVEAKPDGTFMGWATTDVRDGSYCERGGFATRQSAKAWCLSYIKRMDHDALPAYMGWPVHATDRTKDADTPARLTHPAHDPDNGLVIEVKRGLNTRRDITGPHLYRSRVEKEGKGVDVNVHQSLLDAIGYVTGILCALGIDTPPTDS